MKRTAEFVLGLIGGIFGFIGAILAITLGGIAGAFEVEGASSVSGLGWDAFILSIVGIIGCVIVRSKPKVGGILMLVAAVGGVICISLFYLVPGILLFIAGLMGLIRKEKNNSVNA